MSEDIQKKIFSANLKLLLTKHSKSQLEVANAIGVSPQTFNTWAQGVAIPRMGKLQKLADYFGVGKSALLEDQADQAASEDHYYLDEDARDAAEFLFHNPDYRVLFDASRGVKKEDIDFVAKMIKKASGQDDE